MRTPDGISTKDPAASARDRRPGIGIRPRASVPVFRALLLGLPVAAGIAAGPAIARAEVLAASPADYLRVIAGSGPDDVVRLRPGIYRRGLRLEGLTGKAGEPVVITGPSKGRAALYGSPGRNVITLKDSAYVVLRDLEIDGRGVSGDGVKAEGGSDYAHHITLEGLYIHDLGPGQQTVGISTKCPAWGWEVRGNVIVGVGTGMYFGDSDGTEPFWDGLIEQNLVRDTVGYNLQIKHQRARPEGFAGASRGRDVTTIRYNVFSKARGAGEKMARPNVLVGHWPLAGPGRDDRYEIYGNLFYQNPTEALFQGEGNIALYNNLFFNSHDTPFPAVAIQPHNDIPRKVRVFFNTVVAPWKGIRVLYREEAVVLDQLVFGNAVFAQTPVEGRQCFKNHTAGYEAAGETLQAPVPALGRLDLYPKPGRLRGPKIDMSRVEGFPAARRDFNGAPRTGAYRGAYAGSGENPGWKPGLGGTPHSQER